MWYWVENNVNLCLLDLYIYVEEFSLFILFLLLKTTQNQIILYWYINDHVIQVWVTFNLVARMSDHEILLLITFLSILWVKLWMELRAILLSITINVIVLAVIVGIFVLVCCGYYLLFISPFSFLVHLLRIISVLLLQLTWFPFPLANVL